jgi:hypothetical protein
MLLAQARHPSNCAGIFDDSQLFTSTNGEKIHRPSLPCNPSKSGISERFFTTDGTDFTDGKPIISYPRHP